ncbi:hypothetical protein [Xenorhabdus cabanillasii]|uniref:hypothetical protein n=1 Tax=Xenorhabdus cabanillasii TaxID=351673 RepID=UPI0014764C66|nr:hypothetical protein [Xenorhabdus cabanillasii]
MKSLTPQSPNLTEFTEPMNNTHMTISLNYSFLKNSGFLKSASLGTFPQLLLILPLFYPGHVQAIFSAQLTP